MTESGTDETFHRLLERVSRSGVPYSIHEHRATRTIDDAARNLSFPVEVRLLTGVESGSVSPLMPLEGAQLFVDDVLAIAPTLYCGFGRPDRTLEIAAANLARAPLP